MMSLVFTCMKFLQLRGSPAQLPYHRQLLPIVFVAGVLLNSMLYGLLRQPNGALLALIEDGLHLLLLAGVLWLRSRSARYLQTATAVSGIGVLLSLLYLPPILVMVVAGVDLGSGYNDGLGNHAAAGFLQLVLLGLLAWRLLAEGQLLRHALDLPLLASTTIALVLLVVEIRILQALFPTP